MRSHHWVIIGLVIIAGWYFYRHYKTTGKFFTK